MQWAETGGSLGHGKLVPIPFILFCFSWSLIFYIQRLGNIGEWTAFNEEKERHVIPGLELCARGGELRGLGSDPTQTSGGAWRAACHHSSPDITWRCVVFCSEEAGLVNTRLWKGKEYGDFLEAAWMEQNKRAEQGGFSDFLFCIHQRGQCVKL